MIPTALAEEIKHKMPCLTQVSRKIYHTLKGIVVTENNVVIGLLGIWVVRGKGEYGR